jgi:hypothetical protein
LKRREKGLKRRMGIKNGEKNRKGIGKKEGNKGCWRERLEKGIVEKEGNRN